MDMDLINSIYTNVRDNAIRYWMRTWLMHKFYHDADLCDSVNKAAQHVIQGFTNIREALVDSAIVSLGRGFIDSGDDSLSLTRLIPSSSDHLANSKPKRMQEEEEACVLLYAKWYGSQNSDGTFIRLWFQLIEDFRLFRGSKAVKRVKKMRDTMVAHNLDVVVDEPAEYSTLYQVRDDLVPIMKQVTGLIEGKAYEWKALVDESQATADGFANALKAKLNG